MLQAAPDLNAEAVISLPPDITWATSEWVDVLIDLAAATIAPKAIMLTGLPTRQSWLKSSGSRRSSVLACCVSARCCTACANR